MKFHATHETPPNSTTFISYPAFRIGSNSVRRNTPKTVFPMLTNIG
jgi:hypothetical protein